ncbi:MAG TPA: hypothetical protein VM370_09845 [Candidatus Thermoplasmatota archaeon]|nr:hypothetical protein [Candidatus Thermoplasmatota archaeon]
MALLTGCAGGGGDARADLVPYPHLGDVATYEATGALVDFARWENGAPFAAASAQVRFTLDASADALDGSRALHKAFRVTTDVAEAGVFGERSATWVSARHEAIVQSRHPLSQDQSIVAFDERGFPWLWGASALFGEELAEGSAFPFEIPDDLGRGQEILFEWRVNGSEDGLVRLDLAGGGASGSLWMERGVAWPARVHLTITDALAPHVRLQGGSSATIDARRASLVEGGEPVPPRDRGATFGADETAARAAWDGEKPPDGDPASLEYLLSEAVRDAKLLDKPLADWLAAHDAPILYRATYQMADGLVNGTREADWLLQFVDRSEQYYEIEIARVLAPPLPPPAPALPASGVPRVVKSAAAAAPEDANHGWFAMESVPEKLVTLSEGMRVVRETFGAQELQIFLRSFADPPGYSYFIDGGFEGPGRYTVVYNPSTGFIEEATGPVAPRLAS